jgi:rRNA maturation endonuclease Nob1
MEKTTLTREEQVRLYGHIAIECHGCDEVFMADREPKPICPYCGAVTALKE